MGDPKIVDQMQKYRELEQARFIYYQRNHFHPELMDDFMTICDNIFDVRAPALLTILSRYGEIEKEQALRE
jgi:response regulator RpfG family c-di-GMP phosphodiesterase